MKLKCPVSLGELIDKMTILEIKSERIDDAVKVEWVKGELDQLRATLSQLELEQAIGEYKQELKRVNEALWEIEDQIREKERAKSFDKEFVELARSVYLTNDKRFEIKAKINDEFGSEVREMKSYHSY